MEEQKEIEEMNNITFCHDGEKHMGNDSNRKQNFLEHKRNHSNYKKPYTD